MSGELLPAFPVIPFRWWDRHGHGEQLPAACQISRAMAVAEKAVVADALKTIRQNVKQEAPQELICRQARHLGPLRMFVVLVGEGNLPVVKRLQAVIGDGDPMGIAAQIVQNPAGAAEWPLGLDHPLHIVERRQIPGEIVGIGQIL